MKAMNKSLRALNPHLRNRPAADRQLARNAASSTAVETGKPTDSYLDNPTKVRSRKAVARNPG